MQQRTAPGPRPCSTRPTSRSAAWVDDPVVSGGYATGEDCALFAAAGKLNPPGITRLTDIMEHYEAEQVRACSGIPQCHTDKGVARSYRDTPAHTTLDHGHLGQSGHKAVAELLWPTVAGVLGIS